MILSISTCGMGRSLLDADFVPVFQLDAVTSGRDLTDNMRIGSSYSRCSVGAALSYAFGLVRCFGKKSANCMWSELTSNFL